MFGLVYIHDFGGAAMKFVVADSGQIEARVNAWLSGHQTLVDLFRLGDEKKAAGDKEWDIYCVTGSELFGRPLTKKELERQVSKNLTLGLGFQMGWHKLAMEMAKGMLGSKPVIFDMPWVERLGVDVDTFVANEHFMERVERMPSRLPLPERAVHCAVSHHLVGWYRENNEPIRDFWKLCKDVIEAMIEMEDDAYDVFGTNECLKVVRHGIILPNTLRLRYSGLKRSVDEEGELKGYSYMGGPVGKERKRIYGGLLTENVVQALARVIVYQQAVNLRLKYGYRFATTSHDELVYVVPDAEAETCLERVMQEMRTAPAWAPGLPLAVEGGIGQVYGEAKP